MADPFAGRRYEDRTGKGMYEDTIAGLREWGKNFVKQRSDDPASLGQPAPGDFPEPPPFREYLPNAVMSVMGGGGMRAGLGLAVKAASTAGKVKPAAQLAGATMLTGGSAATLSDLVEEGREKAAENLENAGKPAQDSAPVLEGAQERTFGAAGSREGDLGKGLPPGYKVSDTSVDGIKRVDGGSSPLFTNLNPAEAVKGLRGGTVNTIDMRSGLESMARANAIRQQYLDSQAGSDGGPRGGLIGGASSREREKVLDAATTPYRGAQNGQLTANQLRVLAGLVDGDTRQQEGAANRALEAQKLRQLEEKGLRESALERERLEMQKPWYEAQTAYYSNGGEGGSGDKRGKGTLTLKQVADTAEVMGYDPKRVTQDTAARQRDLARQYEEAGYPDLAQQVLEGGFPEGGVKIDGDLGRVRDVAAQENSWRRGLRFGGEGGLTGLAVGAGKVGIDFLTNRGKTTLRDLAKQFAKWGGGTAIPAAVVAGMYGYGTGTGGITDDTPAYALEGGTFDKDGNWSKTLPDGKAMAIPQASLTDPSLFSNVPLVGPKRNPATLLDALGYRRE